MLPIVFQALPKWDGAYNSTALTISKMLSAGRKVFYVEHPFSITDTMRNRNRTQLKKRKDRFTIFPFNDHPNFFVINPPNIIPINSLSENWAYQFLKKQYIRSLWKRIDFVLNSMGIHEFGYVNSFDPVFFEFNSALKCRFKIYHSVDLIEGEPYIAKHGVKAEKIASTKADMVVTTSNPLKERLKPFNKNTVCIPNAADFKHFSSTQKKPVEYQSSNRKKLVYTGNIGLRIDYGLLERLARLYPDIDIYLVGPKDPAYFGGQKLETVSNIHILGAKNYTELPAYLHHADVLIIPFLKNELTRHIYPLKLNEYLATGKPVITTRFTDLTGFEDVLTILDTDAEEKEILQHSILENNALVCEARIQRASQNTWEHRIIEWETILNELS